MDEGHDCQVQFQILRTCKQVQLRYALVNHEHKHVFPLQGPMFVKPVSCKKNGPFFGTAWLCFCCGSLRSNAHSLSQAPMVAMNVRRMLDVMAGYLNRRMFGYVFCCRVQPYEPLERIFIELRSASDNKHRFKPIRSHVHAGPGLACSVASMSYPSISTDQIIRNYVMIGFQSGS